VASWRVQRLLPVPTTTRLPSTTSVVVSKAREMGGAGGRKEGGGVPVRMRKLHGGVGERREGGVGGGGVSRGRERDVTGEGGGVGGGGN
jgi:hypothetical protein